MTISHASMVDYYKKRALEYERIYHKPERQPDLRQLEAIVTRAFPDLDVLEIACGTGYWTQFASRSARTIAATDYSGEVLAIAVQKGYGNCDVRFIRTDAYELKDVGGSFSAGLVGFWWSHVPQKKLPDFIQIFHSKLEPGAPVLVIDNCFVEGSSTPISRSDDEGNSYQIRTLADGSQHEVLKNFPSEAEFAKKIHGYGKGLHFRILDYFWLARYQVEKTLNAGYASKNNNSLQSFPVSEPTGND